MRRHAFALFAAAVWGAAAHAQPVLGPPTQTAVPAQLPFVPPAPPLPGARPPAPLGLRSFDCLTTEVKRVDNRWILFAEGTVLKDFGPREADARAALAIIRELKLNQYGAIGVPPVMEYWLVDGHAPFSADPNLKLVPLDLNTLRVEEGDGQWRLRDARRLLFAFGTKRADAYLALDVIRHYGFTQLGHLGSFVPSMVYFLGSPSDQGRAPALPPPGQPRAGPGQRAAVKGSPGIVPAGTLPPVQTAPLTERRRFDFTRAEVRRDKGDWKLMCGTHVLANFGQNQLDANLALNTLRHYRFTEHCLLGRPVPVFSYFLIGGQSAQGLKFGLPAQAFRPEAVLVRPYGQSWAVSAGDVPLVVFERVEEARELAEAIQHYRFDHLCRIGSTPGYGMTFFVRTR